MSKYLDCTVGSPPAIQYTPTLLAYFLVVQQQSVHYYTGNTCSISHMHYLLTYIAYTSLQEHTTDISIMWAWTITNLLNIFPEVKAYLQIGSVILGDKGTVALAENCDFLLNVFDVILCFLQINNFNGHNFLSPTVDAFKNFTKRAFPYPVQLCEVLLWISSEILNDREMVGKERIEGIFSNIRPQKKLH